MGGDEGSLRKAVVAGLPAGLLDADISEYLADVAASQLEELGDGGDAESLFQALSEGLAPLLEDYGVENTVATALCKSAANNAFPCTGDKAKAKSKKSADAEALLCNLPNLIMMYGGSVEPLLRNATLSLAKGHRYGVVGSNGSGKSTLMGRIAAKDIAGFPEHLTLVHLSNEKILQGVDRSTTARDYACTRGAAVEEGSRAKALTAVGFSDEFLDKPVRELSGGWQMRLGLACAMAQKADLMILDEPTNHLDAAAVDWLVDFINSSCSSRGSGCTALIVSHDANFLDAVCSDVLQFTSDHKLACHVGNFASFKQTVLKGDQVEADRILEVGSFANAGVDGGIMQFPAPEKIGRTTADRKNPVLTLQNACFRYSPDSRLILENVNVALSQQSKVAIVGSNGAGKSTLLALLADRLKTCPPGELWWHERLRVSFVAQQHLDHLGSGLEMSCVDYMQARFRPGYDLESPQKEARKLTEKEETDRKREGLRFGKRGRPVKALLSRKQQVKHAAGKDVYGDTVREYLYETQWEDLGDAEITWEQRSKLLICGVRGMVEDLDERLDRVWAGTPARSTATEEVLRHLEELGLPEAVCRRKVSTLSSGQKVKLMFAGAFWTQPHVLCLDEPTNFLDPDSVSMLQQALVGFKGGFAVVTHNEAFAEAVATETWVVADGKVSGAKKITGKAKAKAKVDKPAS